ncbi:MAG: hypothetical protein AAGH74_02935 [Pseudomonadota bacterium]
MKLLFWKNLILLSGLLGLIAACAKPPPPEDATSEYSTSNGGLIYLNTDDAFHVAFESAAAPDAFWCAAGEYARDVIGFPEDVSIRRQTGLLIAETGVFDDPNGPSRKLRLPDNRVIFTRADKRHLLDFRPAGSRLYGENIGYFSGSLSETTVTGAVALCAG